MTDIVKQALAEISADNVSHGRPPVNMAAGRRAFMRNVGLVAAGAGASAAGALGSVIPAEAQTVNYDISILNFALNLEYLEAEYYLRGVFGHGLNAGEISGVGTPGTVIGGSAVPFATNRVSDFVNEVAQDEEAHVNFLRSALGSAAIARPTINLVDSFNAAARAAGLVGPQGTFNPFADEFSYLLGAYIFEDVGVTAYKGAAALITNKAYLTAAAGILAVEAYHAGTIRTIAFQNGLGDQTRMISHLRATLASANDDQGVSSDQSTLAGGNLSSANIVPTDKTGLAFSRTPRQVLNIVYGSQNVNAGGFFPFGVNPGNGPFILG